MAAGPFALVRGNAPKCENGGTRQGSRRLKGWKPEIEERGREMESPVRKASLAFVAFVLVCSTCWGATGADRDIAVGGREFALDLYQHLRGQEGNLFLSPTSIRTALGMTYAGARTRTADEMAAVLRLPRDQQKAHAALAKLLPMQREDFIPHHFDLGDKQKEMYEAFSEAFATKTRDEWMKALDEADVAAAPVYTIAEAHSDAHFKHRQPAVEVDHPKLGTVRVLRSPLRFSDTPVQPRTRPPLYAENTAEILRDLAGMSEHEIDRLRDEGVVE